MIEDLDQDVPGQSAGGLANGKINCASHFERARKLQKRPCYRRQGVAIGCDQTDQMGCVGLDQGNCRQAVRLSKQ